MYAFVAPSETAQQVTLHSTTEYNNAGWIVHPALFVRAEAFAMFAPIFPGLIVSVDAFFIGLSLGLQRRMRFVYLVLINLFLLILCFIGFAIAERVYAYIPFEPDYIVGFSFISLGVWCILSYFRDKRRAGREKSGRSMTISKAEQVLSPKGGLCPSGGRSMTISKSVIIVGLVMSLEAMLITMGIALVFGENGSLLIPATVALAHFGYSALSFHLARIRHMKRLPSVISNVVSGLALIVYGTMSLV
jgi:putative Mn2+ efflux pump MntP